jgi:hypothetical protein
MSVRRQLDGTVGELGLLAAHPERRGDGLGRELVRFAEELSLQRGLATMQLELLVPRGWSHPTKVPVLDQRVDKPLRRPSLASVDGLDLIHLQCHIGHTVAWPDGRSYRAPWLSANGRSAGLDRGRL